MLSLNFNHCGASCNVNVEHLQGAAASTGNKTYNLTLVANELGAVELRRRIQSASFGNVFMVKPIDAALCGYDCLTAAVAFETRDTVRDGALASSIYDAPLGRNGLGIVMNNAETI